jgi:hypothetical protein
VCGQRLMNLPRTNFPRQGILMDELVAQKNDLKSQSLKDPLHRRLNRRRPAVSILTILKRNSPNSVIL